MRETSLWTRWVSRMPEERGPFLMKLSVCYLSIILLDYCRLLCSMKLRTPPPLKTLLPLVRRENQPWRWRFFLFSIFLLGQPACLGDVSSTHSSLSVRVEPRLFLKNLEFEKEPLLAHYFLPLRATKTKFGSSLHTFNHYLELKFFFNLNRLC